MQFVQCKNLFLVVAEYLGVNPIIRENPNHRSDWYCNQTQAEGPRITTMNFHTRKWVKPEDLNPNGTFPT
ncbi:protein of unknown function [Pararobbsia alpina]